MARILMMTSTFPRSKQDTTIAHFVFDLAQSLTQKYGHTIRIIAPHMPNTATFEVWDGVEIVRFRYFIPRWETLAQGGIMSRIRKNPAYLLMVPFFLLGMLVSTLYQVVRFRPEIIHSHWLFPQGFIAAITTIFTRTPYLVTSHGSDISQLTSPGFKKLHHWVLSRAKGYTVVSKSLAEEVSQTLSQTPEIIPMGIHTQYFESTPRSASSQILSVGRLDLDKGFQDVIAVLPLLPQHIHYTIVGEGVAREELWALAEKCNVRDRLSMPGSKSVLELKEYFAHSMLLIHPSRHEGLGLVVLEAMASKVPVLTSDISALRVHTRQGRGVSIDTTDQDLLAKNIIAILEANDSEGVERAYQYSKQYHWDTVAGLFNEKYHNMVV